MGGRIFKGTDDGVEGRGGITALGRGWGLAVCDPDGEDSWVEGQTAVSGGAEVSVTDLGGDDDSFLIGGSIFNRSEERRVGKEVRNPWRPKDERKSTDHEGGGTRCGRQTGGDGRARGR